jgi:hypothetical protein
VFHFCHTVIRSYQLCCGGPIPYRVAGVLTVIDGAAQVQGGLTPTTAICVDIFPTNAYYR